VFFKQTAAKKPQQFHCNEQQKHPGGFGQGPNPFFLYRGDGSVDWAVLNDKVSLITYLGGGDQMNSTGTALPFLIMA